MIIIFARFYCEADEAKSELSKANEKIENTKKNVDQTVNEAASLAEQTKAAAGSVYEQTKQAANEALAQGSKAAEQAVDQQLSQAEKAIDAGLKAAGNVADQKIREANAYVDTTRGDLEKVNWWLEFGASFSPLRFFSAFLPREINTGLPFPKRDIQLISIDFIFRGICVPMTSGVKIASEVIGVNGQIL